MSAQSRGFVAALFARFQSIRVCSFWKKAMSSSSSSATSVPAPPAGMQGEIQRRALPQEVIFYDKVSVLFDFILLISLVFLSFRFYHALLMITFFCSLSFSFLFPFFSHSQLPDQRVRCKMCKHMCIIKDCGTGT